jgi:Siphovirus Gp157
MLLNLPELETGEELDQLSTLLATEEQSGSSQDPEIDNQITQIILRREGEDQISYGKRVDRFINYIQFLNQTNYLDSEIARLQTLKKLRTNLAKRLISMVLFRLEISGVKKVETDTHKISVVGKGGKQPIEIDYDEVHDLDLIPEEFIETKVVKKVNKEAIANYLKANNSLSWARLVERGNRLSIK